MSEPTVDELKAAHDRDQAASRALAARLDDLDPGSSYTTTLGVEMPRLADYGDDDLGHAQFAAELVGRRRQWLEGRWTELIGRTDRRREAAAIRAAGVGRFVEGNLSLDQIVRTTLATPAAVQELEQTHADARVARIHAGRVTEQQRLADAITRHDTAA